jgi:hypothetical protein
VSVRRFAVIEPSCNHRFSSPMDNEATKRPQSRIGLVINEKYRIAAVLGVGGTATVFAARHRNEHRVALKMLDRELLRGADKALRFDRTERWDCARPMQSAFRKTCEYQRL